MASSVSICSNALLALGAHPINSFDEATEHARLCSNLYPTLRNDLLRLHPWNCAVKRVILSPSTTAPAFDFSYSFPLPGDLIRILSVGRDYDDIPYRIEGNRLQANQNVIYLRYIWRNEDESSWDASLVNLAESMMAARLAYAVTGSASLRDSLNQEAEYRLRRAKAIDGQEDPPEELGGYPTYESRF
ncbi:hypothetical protein [uncultured Pluralibacter sp.]|uniref:hypothetical protein n=1 Tax=uncultured Pluralibacter sp. TaxID=1490864 RepID=UPI002613A584|nr:hypothetical protein [uncultured Pluralibacter sp.]